MQRKAGYAPGRDLQRRSSVLKMRLLHADIVARPMSASTELLGPKIESFA